MQLIREQWAAYQPLRPPRLPQIHLFLLNVDGVRKTRETTDSVRVRKATEPRLYQDPHLHDSSSHTRCMNKKVRPNLSVTLTIAENLPERLKWLWRELKPPCWLTCLSDCLVCASYPGHSQFIYAWKQDPRKTPRLPKEWAEFHQAHLHACCCLHCLIFLVEFDSLIEQILINWLINCKTTLIYCHNTVIFHEIMS